MIRLFLLVLAIHLFSFQPSIGWEDSAELIVAGRVLAPMHPPGTPIPVLISHLAQSIPLGSAPMRLHLLQGIVASALVAWIAAYVAPRTTPIAGVAAGLLMGCALWPVAVRAEVYVFSLPLIFMTGTLVERWWTAGRTASCSDHLLAGLALGLGLSCSALLLPYLVVPALVVLLDRKDRRKTGTLWAAGLVLGLAPYLLLPFRSVNRPFCAPEGLATFGGLWDHLSGAAFRQQFAVQAYTPSSVDWLGIVAVLALPVLLWWFARRTAAAPVWLVGAYLGLIWLFLPSSRSGLHLFLPTLLCLVLLAAQASRALPIPLTLSARGQVLATLVGAVAVLLFPWCAPGTMGPSYGPQATLERIADPLRPGDRVMCGEIEITFWLWYARAVEGDMDGIELVAMAQTTKAAQWAELVRNPPTERTWFDFDLPDYADRMKKQGEVLDGLSPDGLLLRSRGTDDLGWDGDAELHWVRSTAPLLSPLGFRRLGYRYHNLARFSSKRDPIAAETYRSAARFLLNQ